MAEPRYFEQCGCGAQFVVSDLLNNSYKDFWSEVRAWRTDHRCFSPPTQPANPVSTTAKGEFGFTRYVPEYEDEDD